MERVCIDIVTRVAFLQFDGFLEVANGIRRCKLDGEDSTVIILVAIEGESGRHEWWTT